MTMILNWGVGGCFIFQIHIERFSFQNFTVAQSACKSVLPYSMPRHHSVMLSQSLNMVVYSRVVVFAL
jgi:hypothetical protein